LLAELRDLAEEFSETRNVVEEILRQLSVSINMLINQWLPRDKCTEPRQLEVVFSGYPDEGEQGIASRVGEGGS